MPRDKNYQSKKKVNGAWPWSFLKDYKSSYTAKEKELLTCEKAFTEAK